MGNFWLEISQYLCYTKNEFYIACPIKGGKIRCSCKGACHAGMADILLRKTRRIKNEQSDI